MTPDPGAIAARYAETGSVRKVAREFGVSRPFVLTRLRWMAAAPEVVPPRSYRPPPPALSPEQAAALYAEGRSARSIAREFACHERTVRRRLAEAGVTFPQAGSAGRHLPLLWQILAGNREGLPMAAIARQVGCSANTVCRYLDLAEVERPRQTQKGWDQRQEIAACLVAGMSCRKTARRLGLGASTVWRAREALGLAAGKR